MPSCLLGRLCHPLDPISYDMDRGSQLSESDGFQTPVKRGCLQTVAWFGMQLKIVYSSVQLKKLQVLVSALLEK